MNESIQVDGNTIIEVIDNFYWKLATNSLISAEERSLIRKQFALEDIELLLVKIVFNTAHELDDLLFLFFEILLQSQSEPLVYTVDLLAVNHGDPFRTVDVVVLVLVFLPQFFAPLTHDTQYLGRFYLEMSASDFILRINMDAFRNFSTDFIMSVSLHFLPIFFKLLHSFQFLHESRKWTSSFSFSRRQASFSHEPSLLSGPNWVKDLFKHFSDVVIEVFVIGWATRRGRTVCQWDYLIEHLHYDVAVISILPIFKENVWVVVKEVVIDDLDIVDLLYNAVQGFVDVEGLTQRVL